MSREINAKIQYRTAKTHGSEFRELADTFVIVESTPGLITVNMVIFVGNTQTELAGTACVTLGVVLPALQLILFPVVCRVVAYEA